MQKPRPRLLPPGSSQSDSFPVLEKLEGSPVQRNGECLPEVTEPQASAAQLEVYSNVNAGPNTIGSPAIVTTRGVSDGPCRQELLDGGHERLERGVPKIRPEGAKPGPAFWRFPARHRAGEAGVAPPCGVHSDRVDRRVPGSCVGAS